MIGKGAHEIRPVTLSEVEKILDKRQGTAGEFGFEQQTTLTYAKTFAHLKLSDAQEMQKELEKHDIKPETAVKIVDLLPRVKSQLLLVLAKDKTELSEKKFGEVEAIIAKFTKKAKKLVIEKPPEAPLAAESSLPVAPPAEGEAAASESKPEEKKGDGADEEKK
jgi:DNA-directed RNA polymerase subunit F